MAINYPKLAAVAQTLIDTNGAPVTFIRYSRDPANVLQPWRGPSTSPSTAHPEVSITVTAVVIPNEEKDDADAMRRGDATAYIAAQDFVTQSPFAIAMMEGFDAMTDSDGYTWRVRDVSTINPGGLRVLYTATLEH